ncbi:MAG: esterase family protein [Bacteroidales bacterium]|nr:esterase family protein [Candidatus Sodaliphilus fimicaballi]
MTMSTVKFKLIMLLVALMGFTSNAWAQIDAQPQGDTIEVKSDKMNRNIKCTVIVPEQYFDLDLQDEQYPVLYLLHGAWGSYRDWPTKANLDDLASDYSVIIVCPDGQDSWYLDSPIDPSFQFETFISKELVRYIDMNYRTLRSPGYRAITGLSMGGHGALWVGLQHPEVFGSCGSMSGGVDITKFPNKWKIDQRLGKYEDNKQAWADHAVINIVDKIKPGQNIIIDDGSEDFFYEVNLNLHKALLDRKIKHDFTIRPGGHTWDYWVNSLDYHMLFFAKAFDRAQ